MRSSVVVPTFNAGAAISALLEKLKQQKPAPPDEIIAVDSGSRDDTRERVRSAGGRVIEWDKPFNHGLTRDAGIAAAGGEFVFLTVQDALPLGEDWLARALAHFADPQTAGLSMRQVPPSDGPLELQIKAQLEAKENAEPLRISLKDHPDYAQYTAAQRLELYRFDNVCSAIRRSAWEKVPFGDCRYAEDYQWARRALEAGFTLVRDGSLQVIHAHRRQFAYEFRRAMLDAWVLDEAFGYRYSLLSKLNRVKALATSGNNPRASGAQRYAAFKVYLAHALARAAYSGYANLMRPLGLGKSTLQNLTRGI